MSAERIDAETLAAFLDGRLSPDDRARVLRVIAENPEEFEVFADAAHAAGLEQDVSERVTSIDSRRPRRRWLLVIPGLAAAGIAAITLWPASSPQRLSPIEIAASVRIVDAPADGSLAARLGTDWDQPGWSATRGEAATLLESARAFRLGSRATDVEFALRAGDSTALRRLGSEAADLATGTEGGAAAAELYRLIVERGAATPLEDREEAVRAARALFENSPWFDLGAWTEGARVALAAGQMDQIRGDEPVVRELRERLVHLPSGTATAALLSDLGPALRDADTGRIRETLSRIIQTAGR